MKVKCEYCNSFIDDSEEKCSSCGAPNNNYKRVGNYVPKTIQELELWYKNHNLPPYEITRFFIGIDYKEPRAFGIYKDNNTGKFVVYKNKDTGERKIRYEGSDEKYAVNELYLKLKEEILNQKTLNANKQKVSSKLSIIYNFIAIFFFILFLLILFSFVFFGTNVGYYNINGNEYYYNGVWYVYTNNDWEATDEPDYSGSLDSYYDGSDYNGSSSYTDIRDSDVYDPSWDSNSDDWDSDSSWDSSDSWDSGGTDWGSDW